MHAGKELPAVTSAPDGDSGVASQPLSTHIWQPLSVSERKEMLSWIPGPPQRALAALETALGPKSNVTLFIEALRASESVLGPQGRH